MKDRKLVFAVILMGIFFLASSVNAAKWAGTPSGNGMTITSVKVDIDNDEIRLAGANFDKRDVPVVFLGDTESVKKNTLISSFL